LPPQRTVVPMKFSFLSPLQTGLLASVILVFSAPVQLHMLSLPDPAIGAFAALREGGPQALERSVEGFRLALERDPASPFRWCDLGEAYLASGNDRLARYCFSRGVQLGSRTPAIQFRAASYYLNAGDTQTAMALLDRVLHTDPGYADIVFSYYDRLSIGVADMINSGVPADPLVANAWLEHVRKTRTLADATTVWHWIAGHSLANDKQASDYVESLVEQRQYSAAAEAWFAYLSNRSRGSSKLNPILDERFETPLGGTPARLGSARIVMSPIAASALSHDLMPADR
jgi:tetratricopeptide (TPR) repeat protein